PKGDVQLSVFRPRGLASSRPCLYFIHGGGMIMGNRYTAANVPLALAMHFQAVCVSVEYHLAPEYRIDAQVGDCVSGLKWLVNHAPEVGVDKGRIIVCGHSGGGGLAVGTISRLRKDGQHAVQAQMLLAPMLDHTMGSWSTNQYRNQMPWTRATNTFAWECVEGVLEGVQLENRSSHKDVYQVTEPATYLDVGTAEIFRDEAIAYAKQLMQDGVQVELHVWAGAFHAAEVFVPAAELSRQIMDTRIGWLER
ncbi:putative alpha/beta hydrolase protein, partial [Microdochium bolleyi]